MGVDGAVCGCGDPALGCAESSEPDRPVRVSTGFDGEAEGELAKADVLRPRAAVFSRAGSFEGVAGAEIAVGAGNLLGARDGLLFGALLDPDPESTDATTVLYIGGVLGEYGEDCEGLGDRDRDED